MRQYLLTAGPFLSTGGPINYGWRMWYGRCGGATPTVSKLQARTSSLYSVHSTVSAGTLCRQCLTLDTVYIHMYSNQLHTPLKLDAFITNTALFSPVTRSKYKCDPAISTTCTSPVVSPSSYIAGTLIESQEGSLSTSHTAVRAACVSASHRGVQTVHIKTEHQSEW